MTFGHALVVGTGGLIFGVAALGATAAAGVASLAGQLGSAVVSSSPLPSAQALAGIPAAYLQDYQGAAATCPGLPWSVLAGIGEVETGQGANTNISSAGAEGPMQFEPATFAAYDTPVPPGGANPPSPFDPTDAIYAAARDLCANGARRGADIPGAIYEYNHSTAYVARVLALARSYATGSEASPATGPGTGGLAVSPVAEGGLAVAWALAQVGTPYAWGGETVGAGFDCSGLVQAAYRYAGIALPRVAQEQFLAGPLLAPGQPLATGDLVFFGRSTSSVAHVGLVVDPGGLTGVMVDAPHAGADVRVEAFPMTMGAPWGAERYVGATRPAASRGR